MAEHFSCYPLHTNVKTIFELKSVASEIVHRQKKMKLYLWLCQTSNRNILSWFGLMMLIFAFSRLITWAYVYITSSYSRYFGVKKKEKKREKEERKRIVEARLLKPDCWMLCVQAFILRWLCMLHNCNICTSSSDTALETIVSAKRHRLMFISPSTVQSNNENMILKIAHFFVEIRMKKKNALFNL